MHHFTSSQPHLSFIICTTATSSMWTLCHIPLPPTLIYFLEPSHIYPGSTDNTLKGKSLFISIDQITTASTFSLHPQNVLRYVLYSFWGKLSLSSQSYWVFLTCFILLFTHSCNLRSSSPIKQQHKRPHLGLWQLKIKSLRPEMGTLRWMILRNLKLWNGRCCYLNSPRAGVDSSHVYG